MSSDTITPDSKPDYAVDINAISKQFQRITVGGGYSSLKSLLSSLWSVKSPVSLPKQDSKEVIRAIQDLTIKVPRGASVGIIGRNGSGKSTLLKLITGIYQADEGYIKINGEIRALIELGAGFHPDFTGRENLYLAGVLYGLTRKQLDQKFDEIVKFAELEDFIDQPVRTYSSGMFMRLGFSLAVNTNPDILIIDEVLAVGDARFVAKCQDKVAELRRNQKTLFMVSHDLSSIERWSDEVIWLDSGKVMDRGEPRRVIDQYLTFIEKGELETLEEEHDSSEATQINSGDEVDESGDRYQRWGSREVEITDVHLVGPEGKDQLMFNSGDSCKIEFCYLRKEAMPEPVFGFAINRIDGMHVIGTNTALERISDYTVQDSGLVKIEIDSLNLQTGTYYLDLAAHRVDGYPYDHHKNIIQFKVKHRFEQVGIINTQHNWRIS